MYPHFWAEYARLRAAGEREALRAHLRRDIIIVAGLTAALGVLYIGIGPIVGAILGRHAVDQPRSLYVAFAVMGVLAALQTVVLPVLGGRRSAWLMATLVFAFTLPNVALSYVLSLRVGAVGPVLASIFFSVLLLGGAWARIHRRPELLVVSSEVPEPVPGRRMLAQGAVAATAPRGADEPFRGFDDIWAAFGKLKEALGLPAAPGVGETKHADTERTVRSPASYKKLDDAVAEALACATWYEHTPQSGGERGHQCRRSRVGWRRRIEE